MTFTVELPNGDTAEARSVDAAMLAVETLIEDATRHLRENVVVRRDGELDAQLTAMAQSAGMLV